MDRFQRNYVLQVETNYHPPNFVQADIKRQFIRVRPPFTIEFDIQRTRGSTLNPCSIRIYNLNSTNRDSILKDFWDQDTLKYGQKTVKLYAGYGKDLNENLDDSLFPPSFPCIINANITECYSVREATNFITTITAQDGWYAFFNSKFNQAFKAGTSYNTIFRTIANSMKPYGVYPGAIGNYDGIISRGNSFNGNPLNLLNELSGGGAFIDNMKINVLRDSEFINTTRQTFVVNSATGLLGTPRREVGILYFDVIFDPTLNPGDQILIQTNGGNKTYNGYANIWSVHHRGMISDSVCGNATTTVAVQFLPGGLSGVPIFPSEII